MIPSRDTARREASRDGSGGCVLCGGDLPSPRARYCTRACQQRSYRLRHTAAPIDVTSVRRALQRRKALVAHTVYECGGCGERFLGERRCAACGLFARALGFGGSCPECETTVLLDDLLGEGVIATA
jgi:ribosomal protein L32